MLGRLKAELPDGQTSVMSSFYCCQQPVERWKETSEVSETKRLLPHPQSSSRRSQIRCEQSQSATADVGMFLVEPLCL